MTEDPLFPFGEALAYAAPLALAPAGPGRWRARVAPLEDTFTLYLKIFRDADGTLKAAFRNPEQNSHGAAMRFAATREGDALRFSALPDPAKPEARLDARLLRDPDCIALFWNDLKRPIEPTRTAPKDAARFFPRPPGAAPFSAADRDETVEREGVSGLGYLCVGSSAGFT